jgi:hypothetical protein
MEKIKSSVKKFVARASNSLNEIHPFCERASEERRSTSNDGNAQISGQQLFSLFTADIIKQEKVFVR